MIAGLGAGVTLPMANCKGKKRVRFNVIFTAFVGYGCLFTTKASKKGVLGLGFCGFVIFLLPQRHRGHREKAFGFGDLALFV